MNQSLILVDSDRSRSELHQTVFEQSGLGYQCQVFLSGEDLLEAIESLTPDVIIIESALETLHGLALCQKLRTARYRHLLILLVSDETQMNVAKAQELQVVYHRDPIDYVEVIQTIEGVIV